MGRRWFGSQDKKNDISCNCTCTGKFTYASLQGATNNFSNDRLMGKGGSGTIYKGVLPNGQVVAVKKYDNPSLYQWGTNFLQMVEVMSSQIRHRNINQVIGYCIEENSLLLVSEYVENGNLSGLIADPERRKSSFDWHKRIAVCIGIARGISYLHEDTTTHVIHRDIKTSNILLDTNLTPKITDFDLVAFFRDSNELPFEDVVAGSFGYLDPEYYRSGKYTEKGDVYAFGVVMLEVISGRKALLMEFNFDNRSIIYWVSNLVQRDRVLEAVDPMLSDFPVNDVRRFIDVALLCTQTEGSLRPSMHEVVFMLQGMCNPCKRALRMFDMPTTDYENHSPTATNVEDEGETNANFAEIVPANECSDPNSELQSLGDPDGISAQGEVVETCIAREQREQDQSVTGSRLDQTNTATVSEVPPVLQQKQQPRWMKMKPGNVLSGSGDLAERLSQTMVFKKDVCPEAVYPPNHTRVFRRLGSRNLYSFDF